MDTIRAFMAHRRELSEFERSKLVVECDIEHLLKYGVMCIPGIPDGRHLHTL